MSPRLARRGERARLSPYVELSWRIARAWACSVTPSARLDWDTQFGLNVSPRLSVRADPVAPLSLRASLGRGFRAPNFSELLLASRTPPWATGCAAAPRRPERSLGANLSASWRIVADIEATLALFRNELWDLIDTGLAEVLAGEQQFRYLNRSRARTQGIESGLSARLGSWLMLEVTYTFTDTRDLARERPLSGRARHRGTGRVLVGGAEHDWTLSTRAQLVGKRHYFDVSDGSAAGAALAAPLHVVIDARAGDRAGRQVDLFASAENLAGAHPRNTPLRPTTIYAGLNLSY